MRMSATLQTTTDQAWDWRSQSACGTGDPNLHFELAEESDLHEAEAKAICHSCPVRGNCKDAGMEMDRGERGYGIWGALNPDERLLHRPEWLLMQKLDGVKPAPREAGALHHDPGTNARYETRLARTKACRDKLIMQPGFSLDLRPKYGVYAYEDCMQALEVLIANPGSKAKDLSARIGKSATRFNDIVRELYTAMGV